MSETPPPKRIGNNNNSNEQEWWLPSFPRWNYWFWTDFFTAGPRNDLIEIIANKVVDGIDENLDPEGPVIQKLLNDHLPSNRESVREKLPFYESTFQSLKHQRDIYLLGETHKIQQQQQQEQQHQREIHKNDNVSNRFVFPLGSAAARSNSPKMPLDATAMGYTQIVKLGSWFVPSLTIKEALLPIVVSLPSNSLKGTITSAVTNAIPLAQPPLDTAMKNAVMGVIRDPQIREMIKSRTQKILRTEDETIETTTPNKD